MSKSENWLKTGVSQKVKDLQTQTKTTNHSNLDKRVELNILIIDDDDMMRESQRLLLAEMGLNSFEAADGEAGLTFLEENAVDLVLLDLNMPGVDGYGVLAQIEETSPDTEVIVVSGEASFENATRVMRGGAIDFLRKPYVPTDLINVINQVAYKRNLKQQVIAAERQLKASEKRYRFIVSHSPDIIYMLDNSGCFTFINQRITELLGFLPEDLVGRHYSELVHTEDMEIARYVFDERRTGERASHNVELRLKCKIPSQPARMFDTRTINIELNAMGVYAGQVNESDNLLGTYGVARDITERKRAEEVIHFQAYHDLLTRLPNRDLFCDRLMLAISQARRYEKKLAVMFLDMDRFKFINDSLGHLIGDQLLQQIASRLQGCLRDTDTLARIGGDEFNILIPELNSRDEAAAVAEKVIKVCETPFVVEHSDVMVSFSIGIAVFPEDGDSVESLIKHADMAMYHIKGHGKNGYEFFADHMRDIYQHRLTIEQGIRRGLEQGEFVPYYQPQVDVESGDMIGVEALVRWNHPEKGMMNPNDFIPLAEETGQIVDIGKFMLHAGCQQLQDWVAEGKNPIKLAVNVSALQLSEPDFDRFICDLVHYYDFPTNLLVLEITESSLLQDIDHVIGVLQNISNCGVGIAVDDFGTGYSSLGYLQMLPVQILKIDRSFLSCVKNAHRRVCVIKAIVAMARELQLDVVIEGVETIGQLDYVREDLKCSIVQGFLLGRPLPAEEVAGFFQGNIT